MIKPCAVCGKEFNSNKYFKKYCSHECAAEAAREQKHEENKRNAERRRKRNPNLIKHCEHCGKEFKAYRRKQRYCSHECAAKYRVKSTTKLTPKPIVIKPGQDALALRRLDGGESICMWCENPVTDPRQHFCSDDCLLKFYAQKFSSLPEGRLASG